MTYQIVIAMALSFEIAWANVLKNLSNDEVEKLYGLFVLSSLSPSQCLVRVGKKSMRSGIKNEKPSCAAIQQSQ